MPAKAGGSINPIYQVKITLQGSKPPIWRRVLVPGNFGLHQVHQVVQIAMGWTNSHLHQFTVGGENYGEPHPDDWEEVNDERHLKLKQAVPGEKGKLGYAYDFGDDWVHELVVEKILPPEPKGTYPVCLAGKRACPPEDVGGLWGYATFLKALNDPNHDEHDSYQEWIGRAFDAEAFDLAEVNQELRRVK